MSGRRINNEYLTFREGVGLQYTRALNNNLHTYDRVEAVMKTTPELCIIYKSNYI